MEAEKQPPAASPPPKRCDRYRILVEFAHRHLDFLMAELESVLQMNGIWLGNDDDTAECRLEPLLNQERFDKLVQERSASDPLQRLSRRPFVLLSFAPESKWVVLPQHQHQQQQNEKQSSQQQQQTIGDILLDRCVLVRSVIELWAMAPTLEDCVQGVQEWKSTWGQETFQHLLKNDHTSWKLSIHTLGTTYTRDEQAVMRNQFSVPFFQDFSGPVQMKDPDEEYIWIREIELDHKGGAIYPRHDFQKRLISENDARPPLCCYFGRVLGRHLKGRGRIEEFTLKNRVYLGPTSMDTELAFVMANLGHVRKGSMVLDPFVGTGSILIACALRGAYCVGTDIDIRVLRGKEGQRDENVFGNFRQYNLPRPELIRSDNAMFHGHFRTTTTQPMYDAIVCDPPYGIRAGARKTGSRRVDEGRTVRPLTEEERKDHIPQTKPYAVSDVMADLLDVAAQVLVMGGRLVYIIPSYADFDPESDLPQHACLRTAHICYQPLSMELGRRLVALEKVHEYNVDKKEEYRRGVWKNGAASAEKCANIRDKIYQAAKLKPGYEEKLAHRKLKRKQHKEAKKKRAKTEHEQQQEPQQPNQQQEEATTGTSLPAATGVDDDS